ncbi:hypothetical protein DTO027B5_1332 [Paecilomyces variotii]|nr:hypothetical protein DTO027B3_973 [Paecilomyces variotii]KAJ9336797.1 hypothetical protein DTO027B5_1332 [Paecilomyces variotii]KAJ9401258.1 hypothetical protein DTO282F9_1844 [Paecilomyces variotii]
MDTTISPEAADIERRKLLEQLAAQTGTKRKKPDDDDGPTPSHESEEHDRTGDEYSRSQHGKFRFKSSKSKSKSRSKRDSPSNHEEEEERHHKHRHHRRRHHHGHHRASSKREKIDSERSASPYSLHHRSLSPNTAFRESLFDALGDDEGAAFWESVYGQPIHTYPNPAVPKGPDGELEQMDEEEYAAYVRAKMWEKTHQGIMEERERLREERARAKERDDRRRRETSERMQFERAMEESLRRGQERKKVKAWKAAWEEYRRSWDELNSLASSSSNKDEGKEEEEKPRNQHLRNLLFWPVESGKRRDVSSDAVEAFMRHAPAIPSPDSKSGNTTPPDLLATLKAERIRWHPDKIQHRYSGLGIDESVMRSVTEVFQIIDRLWSEERHRRGEQ